MRQGSAWRWIVLGTGLAGWLLVAYGWVPVLLEAGYRQESIGWINELFPGRAKNPFENYLDRWHEMARLGTLWCVVLGGAGLFGRRIWMNVPRFFERVVGTATPSALGAIRAWTCAILFLDTLRYDLASTTLLPDELIQPMGLMSLLHWLPIGYEAFLADPLALWAFQHGTMLLLLFGVIGLGTRVVVPAAAICHLVVGGIAREYSFFYHGGLIPWYVLVVLAFTRCDQGWSIDRLWRIARRQAVPSANQPTAEFGWARYAVWTTIAMPYVMAGCSKLYGSGLGWVAADNLRAHLLRPNLKMPYQDDSVLYSILPAPDFLFVLLGIIAIGTELAFGLVLVSRRARLVIPATMVLVHIGIVFLQDILFSDLMLLLLVFYDWRPLGRAVGRWFAIGPVRRELAGPPSDAASAHRRGVLVVLVIVAIAASVWTAVISFYPFTPVDMFSKPASPPGIVEYQRVIVYWEDGTSEEAPLDRWCRLIPKFRFWPVFEVKFKHSEAMNPPWRQDISWSFRPVFEAAFKGLEGRELVRKFLDAAIDSADLRDYTPRPLRLEVQLWRWDFANDPADSDRGVLVDRYVHTISPP